MTLQRDIAEAIDKAVERFRLNWENEEDHIERVVASGVASFAHFLKDELEKIDD